MKHFITELISFFLIYKAACQEIDTNGFFGCFINNKEINDFRTFASHLDSSFLTPQLCIEACSTMGQSLAAIEDGNFCFCKLSGQTNLEKTSDSECNALSCSGNSNLACGSNRHLMVYLSTPSTEVMPVQIYQNIRFFVFS